MSAGSTFTDLGATATDDTDDEVAITVSGAVNTGIINSYIITYSATDAAGNQSTLTRTVNVIDDTAPVIRLAGDSEVSHRVNTEYVDAGASATDNIDGDVEVTVTGSVDTSTPNSYTLTYSATDAAGNETSLTRTISVFDDTAPVITLTGDAIIAHNYGDVYTDQGATATDNVDATVTVTVTGGVTIDAVNSYTITYTATDAAGNEATPVVRTVNVDDLAGPVITLNGDNIITLGKGRVYKELGATALDNVDGELIVEAPTGTVDYDTIGQYELTYSVSDSANNVSSLVRTVDVVAPRPFITTWKSDNPGSSNSDQITITTNTAAYPIEYKYSIDWGDGETDEDVRGDITHTYTNKSVDNTYTVTISGDFPQLYFFSDSFDNDKLLSVEQWGDGILLSLSKAFVGCDNLVINASDTPNLRSVTDMSYMFNQASSFDQDINSWDVSAITNMNSMFEGASSFNQALNSWDVSSVLEMESMFWHATSFNQDISQWDMSSVTNTSGMFSNAIAFNQNIGAWDVSSVTTLQDMFNSATSFDQDLSPWNIGLVTSMKSMFYGNSLSTENYDALLNSWSKQNVQPNVNFGAGNSLYSPSSQGAKDILIGKGWYITDGITPQT